MIPVIKAPTGRQPITSAATTGLNATRNPENMSARHVVAPLARLNRSNQPQTSVPGVPNVVRK